MTGTQRCPGPLQRRRVGSPSVGDAAAEEGDVAAQVLQRREARVPRRLLLANGKRALKVLLRRREITALARQQGEQLFDVSHLDRRAGMLRLPDPECAVEGGARLCPAFEIDQRHGQVYERGRQPHLITRLRIDGDGALVELDRPRVLAPRRMRQAEIVERRSGGRTASPQASLRNAQRARGERDDFAVGGAAIQRQRPHELTERR